VEGRYCFTVDQQRRNTEPNTLLDYGQFKRVGYGDYNTRFLRYFLTRIEIFIAEGPGKKLQDSTFNYVSGIGKGNAYHVEHILARNDESRALFLDENGEYDESLFEAERNRFGALLLLKGRDNSSSGNERYADKLRTYTGKAPYLRSCPNSFTRLLQIALSYERFYQKFGT
jgi:Protein of unknown function (DUF1524)